MGPGPGTLAMLASPPLVAAYLAWLVEEQRRLSAATIRLLKAALAAIHKASGHPAPTVSMAEACY